MKLIWWRSEFSIENEMLIWSLSSKLSNCRKRKKNKKWCDNWSIKLSFENSLNVETLVWCVFIQYIKFVVVVSSYSLLNTSIENQTSKSISFYSWKRQFNIDRNIKLARALLTRVMIILRNLLVQLLVQLNNADDDVVQKKKTNFRVFVILVAHTSVEINSQRSIHQFDTSRRIQLNSVSKNFWRSCWWFTNAACWVA